MGKLKSPFQIKILIALGIMVYFCSYITRINYAAIIVELISSQGITKSQAAIVTTVAFVTYGAGQLISGFLGDRLQPRWLIFYGFSVTVAMNFLMPLVSGSVAAMAIVWGINGVAQAFMWPPLVKIMTSALSDEVYSKAVPLIGMGSASATIAVYLFAPLIIKLLNWEYVFYIFGLVSVIGALIWIFGTRNLLKNVEIPLGKIKSVSGKKTAETEFSHVLLCLLPIIVITIAVQGVLRDGISTWVPTFISEVFHMKSTVSILTGVALPIFHIICSVAAYKILKFFKNQVFTTITSYFAVIGVLLILLYAVGGSSMWTALLLLASVSGLIHSVNLFQTAYVPKYFDGMGSVATICGLMNFSTYIGSAISTYLFAVISEAYGWNMTILSWIGFAAVGMLVTLYVDKRIKRSRCSVTEQISEEKAVCSSQNDIIAE